MSNKLERFKRILVSEPFNVPEVALSQILSELKVISTSTDIGTASKLIVETGLLTEEEVTKALSVMDGVEYYDYFTKNESIDRSLIDAIPKTAHNYMKQYGFIYLEVDHENRKVVVGFRNPNNNMARGYAKEALDAAGFGDYEVIPVIVSPSAIEDYIFYNLRNISAENLMESALSIKLVSARPVRESKEETEREENEVRDFLVKLVAKAVFDKISDIHFEPKDSIGRIKVRRDGVLENLLTLDISRYSIIAKYIANITVGVKTAERGIAQDGRIEDDGFFSQLRTEYNIEGVDFRVSMLPNLTENENNAAFSTDSIVIRLLSKRGGIPSLDSLGFNDYTRSVVKSIANKATGIFLITGPTGSGKTTTLYSVLSRVNGIERNIITVEDPVEYRNPMWKQTQVRRVSESSEGGGKAKNKSYDFGTALKHMLRHDPDVILLGEIRDEETAKEAFRAANTGHLVLTTLHTNDTPTAILRLEDLGVDRFLIANTVLAISAQRLVRTVCPYCSIEREATDEDNEIIYNQLKLTFEEELIERYYLKGTVRTRGKGCPKCRYTGYTKRTVISEIINFDLAIKELVMNGNYNDLYPTMIKQYENNMLFLDGLDKVRKGITTLEELQRVT